MQNIDERVLQYMPFFGNWVFKDPPEMLGRGNSGTVYRIWNKDSGGMLDAAMKVIPIPRDDRQLEAWLKEAGGSGIGLQARIQQELEYVKTEIRTMETLKADSHIVCFEDYKIYKRHDTPLGWDVLIRMERLVGLNDFLRNIDKYPHRPGQQLVLTIWDELLSGLCLCERNHVLHLDIKPENIFYAEPSKDYFKLGDFGVSIRNEKSKIAGQGTRVGTIDYMSPEMYNFKGSDSRSDMYSLGIVIYELLNGRRLPFMSQSEENNQNNRYQKAIYRLSGKENIPPIRGVDKGLMQIILKCVAFRPEDRYDNMQQVQDALRAYRYGGGSGGSGGGGGGKPRSKLPLYLGLGVGGVALLAFALTRLLGGGPEPEDFVTKPQPPIQQVTTGPSVETLPPQKIVTLPPEDGVTVPPEGGVTQPPKIGTEPPEDGGTQPPKIGTEPPEDGGTQPPKIGTEPPKDGGTQPPKIVTEPPEAAPPVAQEKLTLEVIRGLTEDNAQLVVRASRPVEVTLYYFGKDEEIAIDEDHLAAVFQADGETPPQDMSALPLIEGDIYVLAYVDEQGEEQHPDYRVGPSTRAQIELQISGLSEAEGQSFRVAKGDTLSGFGKAEPYATLTARWQPADADGVGSEVPIQCDSEGNYRFKLSAGACGIDEAGVTGDVIVGYTEGVSASRAGTQSVVWTLDQETRIDWDTMMDGDEVIRLHGEPRAMMQVWGDGEPMGEARQADENGDCDYPTGAPLSWNVGLRLQATDAFGNVSVRYANVWAYDARVDNQADGTVLYDDARIVAHVRPGATVDVYFEGEDGERALVRGDEQADADSGEVDVRISPSELPDADRNTVSGMFVLVQDDGHECGTDWIEWALRAPTPEPTEQPQLTLEVIKPLTEDNAILTVRSNRPVEVTLYYFGKDEEIVIDDAHVKAVLQVNGEARRVMNDITLVEGDAYVLVYRDEQGEEQRLDLRVEASKRAHIEFEIDGLTKVEGQPFPVARGDALSLSGSAEPGEPLTVVWRPVGGEPVEEYIACEDDGSFACALPAGECGIDDAGMTGDVVVSYSDGDTVSRTETRSVVWTLDHETWIRCDRPMDGDDTLSIYSEPQAAVQVQCRGEALGEVQHTDAQGGCLYQLSRPLTRKDRLVLKAVDVFGNEKTWNAAVWAYDARITNQSDGVLRDEAARIVADMRPGATVSVDFIGEDGARTRLVEGAQADGNNGEVNVSVTPENLPGADGNTVSGEFMVVQDDGKEISAGRVQWELRVRLAVGAVDEDSAALRIETEPGVEVIVWREDDQTGLKYEAPEDGLVLHTPEGGFTDGETWHVQATDPGHENRTALRDVTVQQASRGDITAGVSDRFTLEGVALSIVKGGAIRVTGEAEPGSEVEAAWVSGDHVIARTGLADGGSYDIRLEADDGITDDGVTGYVRVRYADGKAADRSAETGEFIWTTDEHVSVEVDPVMQDKGDISVHTDPQATVVISRDGETLKTGTAGASGIYAWHSDEEMRTGDVYRVTCTDAFGNTDSRDVTVTEFSANLSGVADGVARGNRVELSGTTLPKETLDIRLVADGAEYRMKKNIVAGEDGSYSVGIRAQDIDGLDVDGHTVYFKVACSAGVRETEAFLWSVTVPLSVETPLTEDSPALTVHSEPGAMLNVAVDGESPFVQEQVDESGTWSMPPEGFFTGGTVYAIWVYDPNDASRKGARETVTVQETERAAIEVAVQNAQAVDGYDLSMVRGRVLQIEGAAEPNTQVAVWWMRDGDPVMCGTCSTGAKGRFDMNMLASQALMEALESGCVGVNYADGKAQSRTGWSDWVYWTTDDSVALTIDECMEGEKRFNVHTDPNASVTVYVNDMRMSGQKTRADGNGLFEVKSGIKLRAGDVCRIEVTDEYGNTNSGKITVQKDPYRKIVVSVDCGEYINAATPRLTFTGEAEPGSKVVLHANGRDKTVDVNPDDGTFRWAVALDTLGIPDEGTLEVQAEYAEGHVNRAANGLTVAIDRVVPVLDVDLSALSARSTAIAGTTEPGATVTLEVDGKKDHTTAGEDGAFAFEGIALNNNATVSIVAKDAAGNASEPKSAVIGLQEAARIFATVNGGSLNVQGWLVCEELGDLLLRAGNVQKTINSQNSVVEPEDLEYDLAEYEQEMGVKINTKGKICVRIDQKMDISKLEPGDYELILAVDDYPEERTLASVPFTREAGVSTVPNEPVINEDDNSFAFGLDDAQPMNGRGLLLTGWYYGTSAGENYTVSEVRVVDARDDDEVIAELPTVDKSLNISGGLTQGYAKLIRKNLDQVVPRSFLSRMEDVKANERSAGFMIWIDSFNLPDGEYKVIVILQNNKKYHPSMGIIIDNGTPVMTGDHLAAIAEEWDPKPVEEPEETEAPGGN